MIICTTYAYILENKTDTKNSISHHKISHIPLTLMSLGKEWIKHSFNPVSLTLILSFTVVNEKKKKWNKK